MKKVLMILLLLALLSGCGMQQLVPPRAAMPETVPTAPPAETLPVQTVPVTLPAQTVPTVPVTEPAPRLPFELGPKLKEFFNLDQENLPHQDPQGIRYGFVDNYWVTGEITSTEEGVGASSFLEPMGEFVYEPANLTDRNRNTVWSEGVPGYGIGEYIDITRCCNWDTPEIPRTFAYRTLCIVNGYAQNETKWRNNSRVRALDVYVNDLYLLRLHLADTIKPQYFDISSLGISTKAGEEIHFRFCIADVYPGEKYDDTCITGIELEFWVENHG